MKVDVDKCLLVIDKMKELLDLTNSLNKKEIEALMIGLEKAQLADRIKKFKESE